MKKILQWIHNNATALSVLATGIVTSLMNDPNVAHVIAGTGIGSILIRAIISLVIPQNQTPPPPAQWR